MPVLWWAKEDIGVGLHLFHRIGGTPVARSIGKQKNQLMPAVPIADQTIIKAIISCAMHNPLHEHKSK